VSVPKWVDRPIPVDSNSWQHDLLVDVPFDDSFARSFGQIGSGNGRCCSRGKDAACFLDFSASLLAALPSLLLIDDCPSVPGLVDDDGSLFWLLRIRWNKPFIVSSQP
jgi:hypothetical protein